MKCKNCGHALKMIYGKMCNMGVKHEPNHWEHRCGNQKCRVGMYQGECACTRPEPEVK